MPRFISKILIAVSLSAAIGLLSNSTIHAQPASLSDDASITMITILPGTAPEELFGHSAFRVIDPQQNLDIMFNYGTFQFDEYFLPKFIYGELNYFLSVARTAFAIEHYRERRRPIIEQVLNLTPDQRQSLYGFLIHNAREENRYYLYDFLFDNCSTRIRDAMETVFGDEMRFEPEPDPQLTFREMIALYVDDKSFIHFGIDLLLGKRIDRTVTPYEAMFLPDFLELAFDHAVIVIDGEEQPLVVSKQTIMTVDDYGSEPAGMPWMHLILWTLFLGAVWVTWKNQQSGTILNRWFDIPLFTIVGIIGLLITFLWFISLHHVTADNINLFWAWPFHVFVIPFLFKKLRPDSLLRYYFALHAATCLVILLGWFFWTQEIHSAILPLLLTVLLRSGWAGYSMIWK
jgi:hypothetical protein